jgi:putative transcriptional regulator
MTAAVFEWDDAKSERNPVERGFDNAFAARIFEGDTIERDDTRRDYGERRIVAVGEVDGIALSWCTPRAGRGAASSRRGAPAGESDMSTNRRLAAGELRAAARADVERLRATTEDGIAQQLAADPDTAPDLGGALERAGWRVVRRPVAPDVRRVRAKLGLSQAAFAERFGLSTRTVQEWEQGRAVPDQPARVLLKLIEQAPDTVARIVHSSDPPRPQLAPERGPSPAELADGV